MYQRGRAGDEAKKHKSPAKSGRVGITGVGACNGMRGGAEGHISTPHAPCPLHLLPHSIVEVRTIIWCSFYTEFTFDRALSHNLLRWYWQENSQERRV